MEIAEKVSQTGINPVSIEKSAGDGEKEVAVHVYPYFYMQFNSARKGQKCRRLETGHYGNKVQVEFEDGEKFVVDRVCLSRTGRKKGSREPRKKQPRGVTIAAMHPDSEGE